jgi:hypothetical protein
MRKGRGSFRATGANSTYREHCQPDNPRRYGRNEQHGFVCCVGHIGASEDEYRNPEGSGRPKLCHAPILPRRQEGGKASRPQDELGGVNDRGSLCYNGWNRRILTGTIGSKSALSAH